MPQKNQTEKGFATIIAFIILLLTLGGAILYFKNFPLEKLPAEQPIEQPQVTETQKQSTFSTKEIQIATKPDAGNITSPTQATTIKIVDKNELLRQIRNMTYFDSRIAREKRYDSPVTLKNGVAIVSGSEYVDDPWRWALSSEDPLFSDIDGDGDFDALVALYFFPSGASEGTVAVLFNHDGVLRYVDSLDIRGSRPQITFTKAENGFFEIRSWEWHGESVEVLTVSITETNGIQIISRHTEGLG